MEEKKKWTRKVFWFLLLWAVMILLGNYHVVTDADGIFVKRPYFWFSDIISSVDACTSTSWITAQNNHPSLCKALQTNGDIETNQEMDNRLDKEFQDHMEEYEECTNKCDFNSDNYASCIRACN